MKLDCYRMHEDVPEIRPATLPRDWMDEMDNRHAYRCLPLNMANVSGWEILCTDGFEVSWSGGKEKEDITIVPDNADTNIATLAHSHFKFGILTFHTGYLFRTPKGWATWAMGPPNRHKDIIQPLSGLVETDWLPYPFTMNWRFTRPGSVRFEKGEPFCYITMIRPKPLEAIKPKLKNIEDNSDLQKQYETWKDARAMFNMSIEAGSTEAIQKAWQKYYMRGERPDGSKAKDHTNRRRLNPPEEG